MGVFSNARTARAVPVSDAVKARNGARWFYWIGGLSVLNSVVALFGSTFMLVFGLASTLLATYIGVELGGIAYGVGIAVAVLVGLGFVGLGWMAERGAMWAFITGAVLYGLDAGVSAYLQDWFGLIAHVVAFTVIVIGAISLAKLKRGGEEDPIAVTAPGSQPPGSAAVPPAAPAPGVTGFAEATAPPPLD